MTMSDVSTLDDQHPSKAVPSMSRTMAAWTLALSVVPTAVGGQSRRKVDQPACHLTDRPNRQAFSVTVEQAELPKRSRP